MDWRIPFGDLKVGPSARKRIAEALDFNWVSEGRFVREFEEKFAERFAWKHAIATSSGTDAGIVVWSAVRELVKPGKRQGRDAYWQECPEPFKVITPACSFVATANCILAAGMEPAFIDIRLGTLNLDPQSVLGSPALENKDNLVGVQFVATMGKPFPVHKIAELAVERDLWLVGDFCEGHGARFDYAPADSYCDVALYSFYTAHIIVGGEGGCICTDDDDIAELCRSIKSHGRSPGSNYFDFQRVGFNSKWNEFCAAVALESLERFDETFAKRREVRRMLVEALSRFEDDLIIYRDGPGEVISPHAFPIVLKDENRDINPLYDHLEKSGVQVKTLFGSLPTQHKTFEFLGHKLGDFPVAERVGRGGLHFGCNEFMTAEDAEFIADKIGEWLKKDWGMLHET